MLNKQENEQTSCIFIMAEYKHPNGVTGILY